MWTKHEESRSVERDGGYHLVRRLSEDPIGALWVAESESGGAVTLRVLREDLLADQRFGRWLRLELRPISLLRHPNVLGVISANGGREGEIRSVVMAAFDGESLAQKLKRVGALDRGEATIVARQVEEALNAAHEIGLVHGGVSADNVLLTPEGGVKVIDFGIPTALWLAARHARRPPAGGSDGSVPELIAGEPDRAQDAQAAELLMQHMLSGAPPAEDDLQKLVQLVLEHGPQQTPSAESRVPGRRLGARRIALAATIVAVAATATIGFLAIRSPSEDQGSHDHLGRPPSIATTPPPQTATAVGIPDVEGLSAKKAERRLAAIGLVVADADPTLGPPGLVVGTDPPTGQLVAPGTTITLLVGATPDRLDGS
jgi:serine/threonine protein kinase